MIVELLKYTNEPEKTCAIAGRLCYSAVGIEELKEKMTQEKIEDILKRIIKSGHLSVLEPNVAVCFNNNNTLSLCQKRRFFMPETECLCARNSFA